MGNVKPETLRTRQSYFARSASEIVENLEAQAAIVIVLDQNGAIGLQSHALNHSKAVELLSVGIHMVLTQHDQAVMADIAQQNEGSA